MCCAYNSTDSLLACTKHTHTDIYTYTHTFMYTHTRAQAHKDKHMHTQAHIHTHALKRWPKHIGTCMHTNTSKNIQPINTKICATQLAKLHKPKLIWI